MSSKQKEKTLNQIADDIKNCAVCQKDSIGLPVPGEGNADADIMFVGEAPGKTEAKTGRPFVGRSGKLLRSQIKAMGLDENDVYITSPVKYLPKQGTPTKAQILHGREHFLKQLEIINPKIVVLMGKVAALGTLNKEIVVSKLHGQHIQEHGKIYFFLYHPAAAVRFQKLRHIFIEDIGKLKHVLEEHH